MGFLWIDYNMSGLEGQIDIQNFTQLGTVAAASGFFHALKKVRTMYEGRRAQSPFDDSAAERLRRMGLADGNGVLDRDAIAVCSCIFAGQFFDDLCDYYESYEDVWDLISGLSESAEEAARKQKFLLVCLQYDAIYRTRCGGSAGIRRRQSCSRRALWPI